MKKFLYAVAAVLALAPLAAIAPASAAAGHPAVAEATCTGGWQEVYVGNYNWNTGDFVGYWYVSSGDIFDGSSHTLFCEVILSGTRDTAFRQQGTSDCVAYVPSSGLTEMKGCDYSSANQEWIADSGGFLTTESATKTCLDSSGLDVFMNTCTAAPDNQEWVF
jgi:hypothetical protein